MPKASRLLPLICLLLSLCAPALAAQRGFFAMDTYMAVSCEGENAEAALEAAEARVRELEALWSATDENSEIYALDPRRRRGGPHRRGHGGHPPLRRGNGRAHGRLSGHHPLPGLAPVGASPPATTACRRKQSLRRRWRWWAMNSSNSPPARRGCRRERRQTLARWARAGPATKRSPCCASTALPRRCSTWAATCRRWGAGRTVRRGAWAWSCRRIRQTSACWKCATRRWSLRATTSAASPPTAARCTATYSTQRRARRWKTASSSVTVVGAEGKKCDGLSTALFVMGRDAAIEHWQTYGDFEMVLLTEENEV